MAPGLPYAIGIQHAFPDRQVIGYVGDGGFAMLMAEFLTAIKHSLPVKIGINSNYSLGRSSRSRWCSATPSTACANPSRSRTTPRWPRRTARWGSRWTGARDVRAAVERALGHAGPALVDVNVNPDEPPLPGKVEYQQAKKFAQAFVRGQPRKSTIATTLSAARSTSSSPNPRAPDSRRWAIHPNRLRWMAHRLSAGGRRAGRA